MTHLRSQNQRGMTVVQFLHNRDMQLNTLFVIKTDGIGYYVYKGKEYTVREFKDLFPVPFTLTKFNGKEVSADPRRHWMN